MDYKNKEDAIKVFRELWEWLSENPDKAKHNYPGWAFNGGQYPIASLQCPLCSHHGVKYSDNCVGGAPCIIGWPNKNGACSDKHNTGLYDVWLNTRDPLLSSKIAKQIAELPERQA